MSVSARITVNVSASVRMTKNANVSASERLRVNLIIFVAGTCMYSVSVRPNS